MPLPGSLKPGGGRLESRRVPVSQGLGFPTGSAIPFVDQRLDQRGELMTRTQFYLLGMVAIATFTCTFDGSRVVVASASSTARAEKRIASEQLVREALHHELYGRSDERADLLARSIELTPDYAPARWQSGQVLYRNEWIDAADLIQLPEIQARLEMYERERDNTPKTVFGLIELANWCRDNNFTLQERAHLAQLLRIVPDHSEARQRLGFQRVDGQWIEAAAIWKGVTDSRLVDESIERWRSKLTDISRNLRSRSEAKRHAAEERLFDIRDRSVIPAMEILATASEQDARLVIRALSQSPYHEASLALARIGVFSNWDEVRDDAAQSLVQRPKDGYVPPLLMEMGSPIVSRFQRIERNGRVLYRHAFFREGQENNQVRVLDTLYRPAFVFQEAGDEARQIEAANNAREELERVMVEIERTAAARERARQIQNAQIEQLNDRICKVLRTATGEQLGAVPQQWWDWWNNQNEVQQQGEKQTDYQYQQDQRRYIQQVGWQPSDRVRHECFVAGTPVWTASGMRPIERIEPGDLVLTQDPESGELTYHPVLATTVRPAERLLKIRTGERNDRGQWRTPAVGEWGRLGTRTTARIRHGASCTRSRYSNQ